MSQYPRKAERALKHRRMGGGWLNWYVNRRRVPLPTNHNLSLVARDLRMISNRRAL